MKTRQTVISAIALISLALMFLALGCAKPPTEKVVALQSDLAACKAQGADVFAPPDYNNVSQKMSNLQGLMDGKKYRQATALADSLATDMAALKDKTASNGKQIGAHAAAAVDTEIGKLKSMLTPEDAKLLGAEEVAKCQEQIKGLDDQAAALKTDLSNSAFLNVYNNARALMSHIGMVSQDASQKIEKAKALEAEKAVKSKGKSKAGMKAAVKAAPKAAAKPAAKKPAKK